MTSMTFVMRATSLSVNVCWLLHIILRRVLKVAVVLFDRIYAWYFILCNITLMKLVLLVLLLLQVLKHHLIVLTLRTTCYGLLFRCQLTLFVSLTGDLPGELSGGLWIIIFAWISMRAGLALHIVGLMLLWLAGTTSCASSITVFNFLILLGLWVNGSWS
jgi:hypothetical protein